jgi:hypothetical protein
MSFNALRNAIADFTTFAFHPKGRIEFTSLRALPRTVFTPQDVERAIRRYQSGELTIDELATWGLVLYNLDAFDLGGVLASDSDEVWEILGELSLAAINERFDDARASQLLERASMATVRL